MERRRRMLHAANFRRFDMIDKELGWGSGETITQQNRSTQNLMSVYNYNTTSSLSSLFHMHKTEGHTSSTWVCEAG